MTQTNRVPFKLIIGWLLFTLLLAGGLRFVNLQSLPIFADESIYIRWSQVMRAEPTLRFLPLSDGKQPLYMWATIPFLKIFADPLIAGRVLSGLVGLGTLLGVSFAAYLLFKNYRLALVAGLIWAVLPYAVFFERMALADPMLTFFIIWAFNFMYLALVHQRTDYALFSGFSLGFAWLTKSPAQFAFLLLPTLLLFNHSKILKSLFLIIMAFTLAFGMYNILRLGPEFHQIALRNSDYVFPIAEILRHPLDPLLPHLRDSLDFVWNLLTPVGLLFLLAGLFDWRNHHFRARLVLAAFIIIPIFIQSGLARAFTARYLLYTVPFMAILIAHGLEHLGQHVHRHLLHKAGVGLLVGLMLWTDYQLIYSPPLAPLPRIERSGYLEEWTSGYGLAQVSDQIAAFAKSGPVVVGSEGFFGTPFNALQAYLNHLPNVRVVGVGVYVDSVHEKLTSALADNQVFLVVNSSRFHQPDPVNVGLELIAQYPKSFRPDGTRERLLFFRVTGK